MRKRYICPGLCQNEALAELSVESRLLFACLPMLADRDGLIEDRPKRIRAMIFPYDPFDVNELLDELATPSKSEPNGFITRYEEDGVNVIRINNFLAHQIPHPKEAKSALPKQKEQSIHTPVEANHEIPGLNQEISNRNYNYNLNSNYDYNQEKLFLESCPSDDEEQVKESPQTPARETISKAWVEEIYQAYPRKQGKQAALKEIRQAIRTMAEEENIDLRASYERLLAFTREYTKSQKGKDPQYVPYPERWYKKRRWEDDQNFWKPDTIRNTNKNFACEMDAEETDIDLFTNHSQQEEYARFIEELNRERKELGLSTFEAEKSIVGAVN